MAKISIKKIEPSIGLPGGSVKINGKGFLPWEIKNEDISFCNSSAWIDGVSETTIITTIPQKIVSGEVLIDFEGNKSNKVSFNVPEAVANGLHLVDNPAIDTEGNIYGTYSGSRGESTHVSVYKITPYGEKIVYLKGLTNATSIAVDKKGRLYVASRFNGKVYRSTEEQEYELYSQGLGVAFGLAFNSKGDLFAGDRSGSIFKISDEGIAQFYASLPQSYISFHLAFDKNDVLYATNPTHIGENYIYRIDNDGNANEVFSGHSMFHGFCFDEKNRMYISEAKRNESRVLRVDLETKDFEVIASGTNFIGSQFDNEGNLLIASSTSIFRIKKELL
jgi:sugar lactone lactonase YvrE